MPSIASLLDSLPEINQSRLVASGFGVWIVWKEKLNKAVPNTLREYGALCIAEEANQALWFCNTSEIVRALARLQVWARVNPMPVMCQLIPMTFLVDYESQHSISISPELDRQDANFPHEFELLIHPKLKTEIESVAGLRTQVLGGIDGLAPVEWLFMHADQGMDYESSRRWYFVIKPLGNKADKEAILGWRDFSTEIVELLQRMGLKYISDVEEGFLFFPLDSFNLLRSFCTEILTLIKRVKDDPERMYWPVVMVAVGQNNLSFSVDLPKKIGLDWNRLASDYPHVHFMEGLMLSEWFRMNEATYGTEALSLESWCTISLRDGTERLDHGTIQVVLPSVLLGREGEGCYYCGQFNHKAANCPSKGIQKPRPGVWSSLAKIDMKDFSKGFAEMDTAVSLENYSESMAATLSSSEGLESLMAKAVFEINVPSQVRTMKIVWRSRSKEWADGLKQLAPQEGDYVWEAVELLEQGELEEMEGLIREAQVKYPRSYQPHCLWGFWYMEKGDPTQAMFHWQEAERMSYTPMQQSYLAYLQGRLMEIEGNLKEAINTYKNVNTKAPTWIDPVYRQGVCMVKMGFTGQAMDLFMDLVDRDPHIFNRILVDPELDRGRVQLMSTLWERWAEADREVKSVRERVEALKKDIASRFDSNHSFYEPAIEELDRLANLGQTNNYVAYRMFMRGADRFKSNLDSEIKRETKRIDSELEYQSDVVRNIQKEAAWFPFPRLLLEFNKDFNFCVDKINWIKTQHLSDAETFRRATMLLEEIEGRIAQLQKRLVTLRIIRDSTLFVLMLGRNFIWLELIGLGLALVAIPATLYFTQDVQGNWILDSIRQQQWEVTKGLVIILSIVCLAVAAIKSAFSFDKRKRELFEQLDDELRKAAPRRY